MNPIFQMLHDQQDRAVKHYHATRQPFQYFRAHTQAMDKAIVALWEEMFGSSSRLCVLATGGFGRGELYPHSDLDMVIIAPDELSQAEQEIIANIVQILWDKHLTPAIQSGGLAQIAQMAQQDLNLDTALLEARFLCGHADLAQQALQKFEYQRDKVWFIENKIAEMQQRHIKQTALSLEPNIKNGTGGLRDIHTMIWLIRVQGVMQDLMKRNVMTRTEAVLLRRAHRSLAQIRIDLHLLAKREEDRLSFDMQAALASQWCADNPQKGVEKLMHGVYRTIKTVLQLNGILIPMLRGRLFSTLPRIVYDIDADYYQVGNKISVRDLTIFTKQPEHLFIVLERWQENPSINGLAPRTLRAWWTASRHIHADFYGNPNNRRRFVQLFYRGTGLTHIMRFLNLYGVLARYLPAWSNIVGLLQHDLFHAYPVDDHILMVLRNMRRLAMEQHSHELPQASTLMQHFDKPAILYLAALFHDIAKGRGGDHAKEGGIDARQFARDHFLSKQDEMLLVWLVQEHLLMSRVSQKEDISQPEVIEQFCQQVKSMQRLTALYLLTICDIRGTNPKIWNTWKAQLLEHLYQLASTQLLGSHTSENSIQSKKRRMHDQLIKQGFSERSIRRLYQSLGEAYFARHSNSVMAWQLPHIITTPDTPYAYIEPIANSTSLQALIYMPNQERLFTRICRIFSQHGLDIATAHAFVTEHDFILDSFIVNFPEYLQPDEYTRLIADVLKDLTTFAHHAKIEFISVKAKPGRRARLLPIVPRISLEQSEHNQQTLEIVAANRPYLLADLTEVLAHHQVRVYYAKIATFAERVEDSFLVACPKWEDPIWQHQIKQDLLTVLSV